MSDLYEVYRDSTSSLPIVASLPEEEAYLLNLRLSALDTLHAAVQSGSAYRQNPPSRSLDEIQSDFLDIVDGVPRTIKDITRLIGAKNFPPQEQGLVKEKLITLLAELDGAKTEVFVGRVIEGLLDEYSEKFGLVLNSGTVASLLSSRITDFDGYISELDDFSYAGLSAKDRVYVEKLLFMLEAFRNISDDTAPDLERAFYDVFALFTKKNLVLILDALNYYEGEDGYVAREYTDIVGTHESPVIFQVLYLMSKHYPRKFSRFMKSETFTKTKRSSSAEELLVSALDNFEDDIGQGKLNGDAIFKEIPSSYQSFTKTFTLEILNSLAGKCVFPEKSSKFEVLDFENRAVQDQLDKAQAAAEVASIEQSSAVTSTIGLCYTIGFCISNLQRTAPEGKVAPYDKFQSSIKNARSGLGYLKSIVSAAVSRPLMPARELLRLYCDINITQDDLGQILSEDNKPKLKNLSYMRWTASLYALSNPSREWANSGGHDGRFVQRILGSKKLDQGITAMLHHIRSERASGNAAYMSILNRNVSSDVNPFIADFNQGFKYHKDGGGLDQNRNLTLDPTFAKDLIANGFETELDALFPKNSNQEYQFYIPSAAHYGFMGAVLAPYDDFNDLSNYKFTIHEHSSMEYPSIRVYETAAFNPAVLMTGHTLVSDCCMYPHAWGSSTVLADFIHCNTSTLWVVDMAAKNSMSRVYYNNDCDVVVLGTCYLAKTYVTLKDPNLVSTEYALSMVEGDTKLFLKYNLPVPYSADKNSGAIGSPLLALDGWETYKGTNPYRDALIGSLDYGTGYGDVAVKLMYNAISNDASLNFTVSGVYHDKLKDAEGVVGASEYVSNFENNRDNVYTDGSQSYSYIREDFLGSTSVADASSVFQNMVVSFDSEGDNAVVGYTALDGTVVPQVEVSWDYLRYMFSFPMGNAFVPFEGSVIFDTSPRNESVCLELLTPSWFASADEKPLVRGDNSYDQADLIAMRTPQGGAFIGREQIL